MRLTENPFKPDWKFFNNMENRLNDELNRSKCGFTIIKLYQNSVALHPSFEFPTAKAEAEAETYLKHLYVFLLFFGEY